MQDCVGGAGFVLRDSKGFCVLAGCHFLPDFDCWMVELVTIKLGMQ